MAALVALTQAQLAAQLTQVDAFTAAALTLAGIDATLIGVAIAGVSQLGRHYSLVLGGLFLSTILFLFAAFAQPRGKMREMSLGPHGPAFYDDYSAATEAGFQLQLLADLSGSFDRNAQGLRIKSTRLIRATVLLTLMLGYSIHLALTNL